MLQVITRLYSMTHIPGYNPGGHELSSLKTFAARLNQNPLLIDRDAIPGFETPGLK